MTSPRGQWVAALLLLSLLVMMLVLAWSVIARVDVITRVLHAWRIIVRERVVRGVRARFPGVWTFAANRVSRGTVFGLHLTIGLLVTVLSIVVFARIADDVLEQDKLAQFDLVVLNAIANARTVSETRACVAISAIGAPLTVAVISAVVALLLIARRKWWYASVWITTIAGGGLLNRVLKAAFHRERPGGALTFLHGASWSFPSGHTMGATICFAMLAWLLNRHASTRSVRVIVMTIAGVLIVLVGASRICLGVHYVTDVAGAYAAAAMWLAACLAGVRVAERRRFDRLTTLGTPP